MATPTLMDVYTRYSVNLTLEEILHHSTKNLQVILCSKILAEGLDGGDDGTASFFMQEIAVEDGSFDPYVEGRVRQTSQAIPIEALMGPPQRKTRCSGRTLCAKNRISSHSDGDYLYMLRVFHRFSLFLCFQFRLSLSPLLLYLKAQFFSV